MRVVFAGRSMRDPRRATLLLAGPMSSPLIGSVGEVASGVRCRTGSLARESRHFELAYGRISPAALALYAMVRGRPQRRAETGR